MSWFSSIFGKLRWLDAEPVRQTSDSKKPFNAYILPRNDYHEESRTYRCAPLELIKLMRNDLRLISGRGERVLWRVKRLESGKYQVGYARLPAASEQHIPAGVCVLIPETWLLANILKQNVLYSVDANRAYWALVDASGCLHHANRSGLMANSTLFLEALGIAGEYSQQSISADALAISETPVSPLQLPGLFCSRKAKSVQINWRPLTIVGSVLLLTYMTVLSGWLYYNESSKEAELAMVRQQANAVFERQQSLNAQLDAINGYYNFLQKSPYQGLVLGQLLEDTKDFAKIDRIRVQGALVTVSGVADSATEMLALFSSSPYWQEVRFDKQVRKLKKGEEFSINMVFNSSVQEGQ